MTLNLTLNKKNCQNGGYYIWVEKHSFRINPWPSQMYIFRDKKQKIKKKYIFEKKQTN